MNISNQTGDDKHFGIIIGLTMQFRDPSFCNFVCVGLFCVINCIDSTFYNKNLAFKHGPVTKKIPHNNGVTHSSKTLLEPVYSDPQFDPLYRDYFRQLDREFMGRGSPPITNSQKLRKQGRPESVSRTFTNNAKNTQKLSNIVQNNPRNPHLHVSRGGSIVHSHPHSHTPPNNGVLIRNRPIVKPPRDPRTRFPNDYNRKPQNKYYGRHAYLPDRLGRRPIANCNFQNDVDVAQLFPGLFRSENDVMQQPDMIIRKGKRRPHIKVKRLPKVLWCPEDEKKVQRLEQQRQTPFVDRSQQPLRQFAAQTLQSQTIDSPDPILNAPRLNKPCNPECCKHVTGYAPITEVTVDNVTYNAVNTTLLNQYLPVGVCPDTNTCGSGMCIQHQLTHWVLIWNNTLAYWPPLQFTRIELPGYCTWENVHLP